MEIPSIQTKHIFPIQSMLFRGSLDVFNLGQFDPINQMIPITVIPLSFAHVFKIFWTSLSRFKMKMFFFNYKNYFFCDRVDISEIRFSDENDDQAVRHFNLGHVVKDRSQSYFQVTLNIKWMI